MILLLVVQFLFCWTKKFPIFKWQYRTRAGAGAKITEKVEPELEPKINSFGSATLHKCWIVKCYRTKCSACRHHSPPSDGPELSDKRPRRSAGRSLSERNPDFVDVTRLPGLDTESQSKVANGECSIQTILLLLLNSYRYLGCLSVYLTV